ncbi:S-adenosyl-L-methionine-dependent methyltransferase [Cercophora newfieldiana]|uniref:S-adenosyl-L-methionine-dependent methyltransferase n=1 Tax=Cercophora newfieldiana TaxID=92897 RepID=A0AA39XSC5_9PEZI|nr:S-adenosyl-L-methionine-dependent methyltransferase [Cercophora newfieldiana]
MALPSKQEVENLIEELSTISKGYSDTPDLNGHVLRMAELIAVRTFIKLGVLDAIPKTGSISLEDLSKATGAQAPLLERMGRVVASGFLDQTFPNGGEYKHTKFSLAYLLDQPSPGHLFLAMYDHWFKHMAKFDEYLAIKGQLEAAREPDDPLYNPYTFSSGQEGTPVWSIMAQDPEKLQIFQQGMSGIDVAVPLVDIGGGHGVVLKKILGTYPEALSSKNAVLQDREDVISLAKGSGILPSDVQLMVHDFIAEQPVRGAKAYFMRMILHDYADAVGIEILKRLAAAMDSNSRVLICEMVLLARVGELDFPAAVMDQAVMTMGGKERTAEGFGSMLEAAGLELVNVWRAPGVPGACVEGRLKQ